MIYKEKPQNFNPKFDIVSCFVEHKGEILLLHRQDHKPEGSTWGVPAGKIDIGENTLEAITRELHEETGIQLSPPQLFYFEKVCIKFPKYDFFYHIFHASLDQRPEVVISNKEHKDFRWASPKNALDMPLIEALDDCINLFYGTK